MSDTMKSNHLIAAAPDLLAACEQMVEAYGQCQCVEGEAPNHCPWCLSRAAIAKARGQTREAVSAAQSHALPHDNGYTLVGLPMDVFSLHDAKQFFAELILGCQREGGRLDFKEYELCPVMNQ